MVKTVCKVCARIKTQCFACVERLSSAALLALLYRCTWNSCIFVNVNDLLSMSQSNPFTCIATRFYVTWFKSCWFQLAPPKPSNTLSAVCRLSESRACIQIRRWTTMRPSSRSPWRRRGAGSACLPGRRFWCWWAGRRWCAWCITPDQGPVKFPSAPTPPLMRWGLVFLMNKTTTFGDLLSL